MHQQQFWVLGNIQTLTNKILTDSANNIMAKSLKSSTTTTDVSSATAPASIQSLIASLSTAATWQNITTGFISDISISSVSDKNILRYDNSTSKWKSTADLTTTENTVYNLTYSTFQISSLNWSLNAIPRNGSNINFMFMVVRFQVFLPIRDIIQQI